MPTGQRDAVVRSRLKGKCNPSRAATVNYHKSETWSLSAASSEPGGPHPSLAVRGLLCPGSGINWDLLYRWFRDLDPDALVWDATTFTKNCERFERHGLVQKFFERVVKSALVEQNASNDHFTVDGRLTSRGPR